MKVFLFGAIMTFLVKIMALPTTPIKTTPTTNKGLLRGDLPPLYLMIKAWLNPCFWWGLVLMGVRRRAIFEKGCGRCRPLTGGVGNKDRRNLMVTFFDRFCWSFQLMVNWVGLGPCGLDICDPRKWKGLLLRSTYRIPHHQPKPPIYQQCDLSHPERVLCEKKHGR